MVIIDKLKSILNDNQIVLPTGHNIEKYLIEKRGNFKSSCLCVVLPQNTKQASDIIKICNDYNVGIVPQSGNTGLVGGSVSDNTQIILSSDLLNNIGDININNYSISCDAGVKLWDLKQHVEKFNLMYPISLPSEKQCTIAGNICTNAGGISVLRYGSTKDLVLGIEAVLPNGDIYSDMNTLYKRNLGPDIKNLFIGSEGTFGFVTKAVLKLYPKPTTHMNFLFSCDNNHELESIFYDIKNKFFMFLSHYEIFNHHALNLVKISYGNNIHWYNAIDYTKDWFCNFGFDLPYIPTQESYGEIYIIVSDILKKYGVTFYHENNANPLNIRYHIPKAQSLYGESIKHDISVSIDNISKCLDSLNDIMEKSYPELIPVIFGHFGDGNIHYNISHSSPESTFKHMTEEIKYKIISHVMSLNGTFSAEHGVGLVHKERLKQYYLHNQYNGIKAIKKSMDSKNIFNKNKIFSIATNGE